MPVNLLGLTVALEEPAEHAHTPHPDDFLWHTGIGSTLPLASACVAPLPASLCILANTGTGVYSHWLADDQAILNQFADILPCKLKTNAPFDT